MYYTNVPVLVAQFSYMISQPSQLQALASSLSPARYTLTFPFAVSALARSGPGLRSPSLLPDSLLTSTLLSAPLASDFSLPPVTGPAPVFLLPDSTPTSTLLLPTTSASSFGCSGRSSGIRTCQTHPFSPGTITAYFCNSSLSATDPFPLAAVRIPSKARGSQR